MNKKKLTAMILAKLEDDLAQTVASVRATVEAATHEESKPENEYDTRGLEASYLAAAQSKRVAEMEELIAICKNIELKEFKNDDKIAASALVQVEMNGKKSFLFLMPKGGGFIFNLDGVSVQVISPVSPLGEALLGMKSGDTAVVETGNQIKEYEILSVE
ncbi:MAG: GreA/GreB family elongation factor [Bdellovibrionota bacterium]